MATVLIDGVDKPVQAMVIYDSLGNIISSFGGTSASPGIVGGEYNSTLPTLTNGQTDALQFDTAGNLRTLATASTITGADAVANTALTSFLARTETSLGTPRPFVSAGYVYNNGSWDRARGDTVSAYARPAPRAKSTSAVTAASTTSQQLFAANTLRSRLLIQNQDAAINIFINLGAAAVAGAGNMRIAPGASLELTGTSEAVNVIAASGTPAIAAWEF